MVNWLGSQPLFIQVAAGMTICLVGILLATTTLCALLTLAIGFARLLGPQHCAADRADSVGQAPGSDAATEELIRALMQDCGKPRDQVEAAVYCWTDDERRMTASLPAIRTLIESLRGRALDADAGRQVMH
ncbi:MAG: hypothetical protein ISP90_10550 [Nevskia sp.]|nr:hypothetical protein [Nevskia sp.]